MSNFLKNNIKEINKKKILVYVSNKDYVSFPLEE